MSLCLTVHGDAQYKIDEGVREEPTMFQVEEDDIAYERV